MPTLALSSLSPSAKKAFSASRTRIYASAGVFIAGMVFWAIALITLVGAELAALAIIPPLGAAVLSWSATQGVNKGRVTGARAGAWAVLVAAVLVMLLPWLMSGDDITDDTPTSTILLVATATSAAGLFTWIWCIHYHLQVVNKIIQVQAGGAAASTGAASSGDATTMGDKIKAAVAQSRLRVLVSWIVSSVALVAILVMYEAVIDGVAWWFLFVGLATGLVTLAIHLATTADAMYLARNAAILIGLTVLGFAIWGGVVWDFTYINYYFESTSIIIPSIIAVLTNWTWVFTVYYHVSLVVTKGPVDPNAPIVAASTSTTSAFASFLGKSAPASNLPVLSPVPKTAPLYSVASGKSVPPPAGHVKVNVIGVDAAVATNPAPSSMPELGSLDVLINSSLADVRSKVDALIGEAFGPGNEFVFVHQNQMAGFTQSIPVEDEASTPITPLLPNLIAAIYSSGAAMPDLLHRSRIYNARPGNEYPVKIQMVTLPPASSATAPPTLQHLGACNVPGATSLAALRNLPALLDVPLPSVYSFFVKTLSGKFYPIATSLEAGLLALEIGPVVYLGKATPPPSPAPSSPAETTPLAPMPPAPPRYDSISRTTPSAPPDVEKQPF